MSEIKKDIQLTENDLKQYNTVICREIWIKKSINSIISTIISVIIVLQILSITSEFSSQLETSYLKSLGKENIFAVFIVISVIIYGIFYCIFHQFLTKYNKIELVDPNGSTLKPNQIILNDAGIFQKSKIHSSHMTWEGVLKIENNKTMFLFYIDNLQAYIIPKRIFDTDEEATIFLQQAEEFWQAAKKSESKEKKRPWNANIEVTHPEETPPI